MAEATPAGSASGVPPAAGFNAAVQSAHGSLLPLYDPQGLVHYVPEASADQYLRAGYSRDEHHVEDAHGAMRGCFDRARSAIEQLVQDSATDGLIARGQDQALATAEAAFTELVQQFSNLRNAIQLRYPMSEDKPVQITDPESGATVNVDPTQADGTSHAVRTTAPTDDQAQWPEEQRRAAGLISTVPPHLADPRDPFSYAPQHQQPQAGTPARRRGPATGGSPS